ncbi:MAG: hypothetical protein ACE37N_12090 [Pseudohongiellaceae bacterium]
MSELRITDLANPEFNAVQQAALNYGETVDVSFDPEEILAEASAACNEQRIFGMGICAEPGCRVPDGTPGYHDISTSPEFTT